jgi:hypothetical protein
MENLKFAVEMFDAGGSLIEMLGLLHDLDAAKHPKSILWRCQRKYPDKLTMLRQGGRILQWNDRE